MKKIKEQYNKLNEIMENIDNIISNIEKEKNAMDWLEKYTD